jgi:hypothetical protein
MDRESLSTIAPDYGSSVDALRSLLTSSSSCYVTKVSANVSYLSNGIEYSSLEITCSDGIQYGLQAYGKEALELHKVALENISKEQEVKEKEPMVVFS